RGWLTGHRPVFVVGGRGAAEQGPDEPHYKVEPEWKLTLRGAAPTKGARFRYVYDLGDGWGHEVLVEAIQALAAPLKHPVCLAGERACPPEDCGGTPDYRKLLERR